MQNTVALRLNMKLRRLEVRSLRGCDSVRRGWRQGTTSSLIGNGDWHIDGNMGVRICGQMSDSSGVRPRSGYRPWSMRMRVVFMAVHRLPRLAGRGNTAIIGMSTDGRVRGLNQQAAVPL